MCGGGGGCVTRGSTLIHTTCLVPICRSPTILFKDGSAPSHKKGADPSLNEIVSYKLKHSVV